MTHYFDDPDPGWDTVIPDASDNHQQQQPDLSPFEELLDVLRSDLQGWENISQPDEVFSDQTIRMLRAHHVGIVSSLECAIKKASGSAENTSEAR